MRRKVVVDELKHGMYVSALDRPWRQTPFLFKGFEITNDGQLTELKRCCRYVYVDDAHESAITVRVAWAKQGAAEQRPRRRIVARNGNAAQPRQAHADKITVEQEVEVIRETYDEATVLIQTIMEDVHQGKSIDTEGAKKVVAAMVKSVFRNPDALVCFAQRKKREHYSALHCLRVCIFALAFGRHLGFGEEELNLLGLGALLHDIGKMRVPDAILNKPGKLTEREYEIMKSHVPMGVKILKRTGAIPPRALDVVRHHHERHAGHGYMDGLEGDQISQFGRISAIVDVYDALTSDRNYEVGIPARVALKNMYERGGVDLDPALFDEFIQCIGVYPIGSVVVLNTAEVGVVRMLNCEQRLKPQIALVTKPDKTRYPVILVVDLARETAPTGDPYQIINVVPPAMFNIEPVDYLPVKAVA
ncbi:MAG: HD-GYP domain-containing protein [Acidiferrobacterales bacterium]